MEAATVEIDGAIHSAARSLAVALYGKGSGSIGQVATSSFAVQTLTLVQIEDITNFEVGMTIVVSSADGGGSVRSGTLVIDGIDRDLGTIHTTQNLSTGIAAIATNDFIFVQGDYDLKIKGLRAWLPVTAPAPGDNFFTVDRSADASRLAGIRFDASSMPIEEGLIASASRVAREGGKPDHCFMAYTQYANLEKALGKHLIH